VAQAGRPGPRLTRVRAHLLQLDLAWEDPAENRRRAERALAGAAVEPGDLVALPEMYATGFSLNVETTADDDGANAAFLGRLARERGAPVETVPRGPR